MYSWMTFRAAPSTSEHLAARIRPGRASNNVKSAITYFIGCVMSDDEGVSKEIPVPSSTM